LHLPEDYRHHQVGHTIGDKVETILDWMPLSTFHGDIKFKVKNHALLSTAIVTAINKLSERRILCAEVGVQMHPAMIFLFSDGFSNESLDIAYAISREYTRLFP
jgi:hypothetical protein